MAVYVTQFLLQILKMRLKQKKLVDMDSSSLGGFKSAQYMATELQYTVEQLLLDGSRMFPDREYQAVFFGQPTPAVDIWRTNEYISKNKKERENGKNGFLCTEHQSHAGTNAA